LGWVFWKGKFLGTQIALKIINPEFSKNGRTLNGNPEFFFRKLKNSFPPKGIGGPKGNLTPTNLWKPIPSQPFPRSPNLGFLNPGEKF